MPEILAGTLLFILVISFVGGLAAGIFMGRHL